MVRRRGPAAAAARFAGRAAQGDRARRRAAGSPPSCPPGRASTATLARARASTACARCSSRCRGSRCPSRPGSATCSRGARARTRRRGSTRCAREGSWSGSAPAPLGRSGRVALYFREDAAAIGPPAGQDGERSERPGARAAARPPRGRAGFFTDLLAELDAPAEALREALWDLVWAGEVTNDAWAPLRAPRLALARAPRGTGAGPRPLALRRPQALGRPVAGPGPLVADRAACSAADPVDPRERRRALAELLLERYGIVTREQVLAEGIRGGFALSLRQFCNLETLGLCRRGYFIEGMGGAQFALPGAVERLRARQPERTRGWRAGTPTARARGGRPCPALRRGAAVAAARGRRRGGPPARRRRLCRAGGAGAGCSTSSAAAGPDDPASAARRRGRGGCGRAAALAGAVRAGRVPSSRSSASTAPRRSARPLRRLLVEIGFAPGPRRLTLTA